MKARDVTSAVVSVSPETPTSVIAKILRDNAISAMPVAGGSSQTTRRERALPAGKQRGWFPVSRTAAP
jgi:CBS domain-containing protein